MVYVTHDQAEAMTLADRVAVLDQGVVQQVDRPMAAYKRPGNRFVAGFLGWPAMNFVDGRLVRAPATLHFVAPGWPPLPLPSSKTGSWMPQAGKPVVLGIRPEDIELATPTPNAVTLAMEVALVEPLGHAWLATLRRNGQRWVARLADRQGIDSEQTVEVRINMEHAHLFDCVTGLALSQGRATG
jgi:multiple sugar transport system ATP-binding protein